MSILSPQGGESAPIRPRNALILALTVLFAGTIIGKLTDKEEPETRTIDCTAEIAKVAPEAIDENAITSTTPAETIQQKLEKRMRAGKSRIDRFTVENGRIKMIGSTETYDEVTGMHPAIIDTANALYTPRTPFLAGCNEDTEWTRREELRAAQNAARETAREIIACYGIETEKDAKHDLSVLPENLTDEGNIPTTTTGVFEGKLTIPYFIEGDTNYKYLAIPAVAGDDPKTILTTIIKPALKGSVDKIWSRIALISPSDEWRIPLALIDTNAYKNGILWIDFKQTTLQYPHNASKADTTTINTEGLQSEQVTYHTKNHYPQFTDATRDALLKTNGLEEIPEIGDGFILRDIYEKDPDNEPKARYTYTETRKLIEGASDYVNDTLHAQYAFPAYYRVHLVVNALGRTTEYQKKLEKTNANAAKSNSSHTFYNAADISYIRFVLEDTRNGARIEFTSENHPRFAEGVDDLLTTYFAQEIRAKRALGVREKNSKCFHVVGTTPEKVAIAEKPAPKKAAPKPKKKK